MNAIFIPPKIDLLSFYPTTFGHSKYALATAGRAIVAETHVTSSQYLRSPRDVFVGELWNISKNCSDDDWDGYGATGVSAAAIANAANFYFDQLPDQPFPQPSPEPDGEIALEWFGRLGASFSISFGESDMLSYACVIGKRISRGMEPIDSPNIALFKVFIKEISKA